MLTHIIFIFALFLIACFALLELWRGLLIKKSGLNLDLLPFLQNALRFFGTFAQWRMRNNYGPLPPSFPGAIPIIGHAYMFTSENKIHNFIQSILDYKKRKIECDAFSLKFGPFTSYVISDPEDCQTIANTCLIKYYIYGFFKRWIGSGLLTSDAETWKRHRKLLNPAFSFAVLNKFMKTFNDNSKNLVSVLAFQVGKGPFKPDRFLLDYILKTTCQTTLNFRSNNITQKYLRSTKEMFDIYINRFKKIWLHKEFYYKWSSLSKKEDELIKTQKEFMENIIQKRRSELLQHADKDGEEDNIGRNNKPLLDLLLQLEQEQTCAFTENEMLQHLITGTVATFDTTFKALLFIIVLIGSHSHVQDRIDKELQEIFGDTERPVNKQDLSKLVYLEAAIKETLRLYPLTPFLGRTSDKEVKLKKYTLPAGSNIILMVYALNRHLLWGLDAEVYRPERWLEVDHMSSNPNVLAIFGVGKRSCIGKRYAMMILKTTLVHLLRHYRITADISKMKTILDIMLIPESGHEITLEVRKKTK